ncbi:MAG: histidine phosphatase family protein [Candidatus Saccharimonadales bacterium]
MSKQKVLPGKFIIIRHGESEWNALKRWTGTRDVPLTTKGHQEAREVAELVADISIDYAYISEQVRTRQTLEAMIESQGWSFDYQVDGRTNERDYGIYTGKLKEDMRQEFGEELYQAVRRSWNQPIPEGETLKDVYARTLPFYREKVLPRLSKGENVLLVGHGNSIRSMIKYIEDISDEDIAKAEMIFAAALVYKVGSDGRAISKQVLETDISHK